MSGKGKKKDRIRPKPKPDEIYLFDDKCINLIRFGYDVIKGTALRFHVPESCIAIWEGKRNDYGRDDFLSVMCVRTLYHQITCRHECHKSFKKRYEENKLAESELIGNLLFDVIEEVTRKFELTPYKIVRISLAIACELLLFLYSKNMILYPKKMAQFWFECYLKFNKKEFESKGGLAEMYNITNSRKFRIMDVFLHKFIEVHCIPYHTTAKNPELAEDFQRDFFNFLSPENRELFAEEVNVMIEVSEHLAGIKTVEPPAPKGASGFNLPESAGTPLDEMSQRLAGIKIVESPAPKGASGFNLPESTGTPLDEMSQRLAGIKIVESPAPNGASGSNLPESTGTPLDQASQFCGSLAAASQDLPVTSSEELLRHHITSSSEQRSKLLKSKSPFEQGIRRLTLGSLQTKQSSDQRPSVPIATGEYNLNSSEEE